ncbi:MAG: peptidoglycan DD-metalloendopeptidase family protein [Pseudomonadota bacterium]
MTIVSDFLLSMLVISAVLWGLACLFQRIDRRAEHWSALWAAALSLCLLIPVAGLAARLMPGWAALPPVETFSLHLPLPVVPVPSGIAAGEASPHGEFLRRYGALSISGLYLTGLTVRGVILIVGRVQLRRIVRTARPYARPGRATGDVSDRVEVRQSAMTRSAFAWSPLIRPGRSCIVLPSLYVKAMSEAQIADIITHERTHIARQDDRIGLLLRGVVCLCWLSPFAHLLFARWSQAIEIQCDMAVTAGRSRKMRRAYAETLLQALHIMAGRVRQYPVAAFSTPRLKTRNSLRNEKMRLTHIVTGTRPAFKRGRDRIGLSVIAACLALAGTLSIAATASADTSGKSVMNRVSSPIVTGRLTAPFGKNYDPFRNGQARIHQGVDIAAPIGTPIFAPAAGTIQFATDLYDNKPAYGTVVVLKTDDNVMTLFSHLDSYTVSAGQRVARGQQIATVGNSGQSTGPHVHIETFQDGERVDPMAVWDLAVD